MKSHSSLTVVTKKLLFTVGLLFLFLAEAGAVSSNFRVFTPLPVSMERVWSYVAQGETNRLLVWTKDGHIWAVRVDEQGAAMDATALPVYTNATTYAMTPRAAWQGTNWLVVWRNIGSGLDGICGARISASGQLIDSTALRITSTSMEADPDVAGSTNGWLVVWAYAPAANSTDVYGMRVSQAGGLSSSFLVSGGFDDQLVPRVAWGSSNWLVVWTDNRSTTAPSDIYGNRITGGGTVRDGNGFLICDAGGNENSPSLAWNGQHWLVAWGNGDIYGGRIREDGTLLDGSGFQIYSASGSQQIPAVAWDGYAWYVIWSDDRALSYWSVLGARVSAGGAVMDSPAVGIATNTTTQLYPSLAASPNDSTLIVWAGADYTTGQVEGATWERSAEQMSVLGTNGALVLNGEAASAAKGTYFGYAGTGTTITMAYSITNAGGGALTISGVTTSGTGAAFFSISSWPSDVSVGASSNLVVSFMPGVAGSWTATLSFANSSTNTPYLLNVKGSAYALSPSAGPSAGGNYLVITNGALGAGDITNVLVGGQTAAIDSQGANWVRVLVPSGTVGTVSVVIQSTSLGSVALAGSYVYRPQGIIRGSTSGPIMWTQVAGMPAAKTAGAAGSLDDCILWVGGGVTNAYRFDGDLWTEIAGLPGGTDARTTSPGGAVLSNQLYCIGGYNTVYIDLVARCNGTNWTTLTPLPKPIGRLAAGVYGEAIYSVGGYGAGGTLTNVYRFDGSSWTEVAGLPQPRAHHACANLNGYLYAIGGWNVSQVAQTNVYRYNGSTWTEVVGLPVARMNIAADTRDGAIYVFGGSATNVYRYDGTNWTEIVGLPRAPNAPGAAVFNGGLYCVAGGATNVYRYGNEIIENSGVNPESCPATGGVTVVISGVNLCNGALSDVTSVTLCGVAASVSSVFSHTQIVVVAGNAGHAIVSGDVAVVSTEYGTTIRSNVFTYIGGDMMVLGTNGVVVGTGETPSAVKGTDFGTLMFGQTQTNWFAITNAGGATLTISGITTNGDGSSAFHVSGVPSQVTIGGVSNFAVEFLPLSAQVYTCVVSMVNNGPNTPYTVYLSGTGAKRDQTITFPAIADQVSTGTVGLAATAESGLAVSFAVGGGPGSIAEDTNLTFTGGGVVSIVASQAGDGNWNAAPDVTNTFNVTKAAADVYLQDLSQTFDGSPRTVTATTMPAGLTVTFTYDGSGAAPTNAGSYAVTGTVSDVMYQGFAVDTLAVSKGSAGVYLMNLTQVYSGGAKYATVTTMPAGLTVNITYDGGATAPSNAGTYAVTGTVSALNYEGESSALLTILQQSQAITFPAIADQVSTGTVGLAATSESGLAVSFAVGSGPGSIAEGTNLTFTGGGMVSVVASQPGDGNWEPAVNVTNTFRVYGLYTLTIVATHGTADLVAGIYTNLEDTVLTNRVTAPSAAGGTQIVCLGWAMTGNEPASGSGTEVVMTVTNDATLTWLWTTNYWLETSAGEHGSVDVGDDWQAFGVTTQITATADQYYHFTNWSGDVSLGDTSLNPLDLLIDAPKSVTAHFAQNMTTSSPVPVPEEWLAQFGLTNFEEDVNADPDNDGQFTWEEFLAAMTDPTNPLSYFHTEVGAGSLLISWPSASGRVYDVEAVLGMPGLDWTPTEWTNIAATPSMNTVTNPSSALTNAMQFFRTKARME